MATAPKRVAIGIDFGTTQSCVAVFQGGTPKVLCAEFYGRDDPRNRNVLPTVIAFQGWERLYGIDAKLQRPSNVGNTVFNLTRLIGKRFEEEFSDNQLWPYQIVNDNGRPVIEVKFEGEREKFRPEEVCAMVLRQLKKIAESFLKQTVTEAVIAIPGYFNHGQRKATIDAAKLAGLDVIQLINKTTAAALTFGFGDRTYNKNVLVYGLGGGSLCVSVVTILHMEYDVKATTGDWNLGGEEFDNRIVAFLIADIKKKMKKDVSKDKSIIAKLKFASEKANKNLSFKTETTITINRLVEGNSYETKISRDLFNELCKDLFDKVLTPVTRVLKDAKLSKSEIAEVILVGGSSKIPKIRDLLSSYFDGKHLFKSLNPEEAIACGAAIKAAMIACPPGNKLKEIKINDVMPTSIGFKTGLKRSTQIFVKTNSKIPLTITKSFETWINNQKQISVTLYQDKLQLGNFKVENVNAEEDTNFVIFTINESGLLEITLPNFGKGKTKAIAISHSPNLSNTELNQCLSYFAKHQSTEVRKHLRVPPRVEIENHLKTLREPRRYKYRQWLNANPDASDASLRRQLQALRFKCDPFV